MISEANHPEFPHRITSQIVDAVYRLILEDERYRNFFSGGIDKAEIEELFLKPTFSPPALGIILGPLDTENMPSNEQLQTTAVQLEIAWNPPERPRDTRDNLRARLIDDFRKTLRTNYGQLKNEAGELITEGLTRFHRLNPPLAFPRAKPQFLIDRLQVEYRSRIDADISFVG